MTRAIRPKPIVLIVLDGFGYREEQEANAIAAARKPTWDHLLAHYPWTLLSGSGEDVGLPDGQMGNSEVGHLHIGAGRVVYQELSRISHAIEDGSFFQNTALSQAMIDARDHDRTVHIMGLLSPGGVHSHEQHIQAAITLAAQHHVKRVFLHAFLDGRDTPPKSAAASLKALHDHCQAHATGAIASIVGRYYAMDRDKRWDRTEAAYRLLTERQAAYHSSNAQQALAEAYARGETDEFVKPTVIDTKDDAAIRDGDIVVFMNFRADRARQLTRALTDPAFKEFPHSVSIPATRFITLTQYAADIAATVAFSPISLSNSLGEYLQNLGLKQLRLAETEKYAHVTFFFNGGSEKIFDGEERLLIPSPKVATYDQQPEMSAPQVTDALVAAILDQKFDVIICNYANADMIGHTGNFAATVQAIECLDHCLGRVMQALQTVGGEMLITADHGNAEKMFDHHTHQAHTAHTSDPVPFVYMGRDAIATTAEGTLCDVAPTLLRIMDLPIPSEMTGHPLFQLKTTA